MCAIAGIINFCTNMISDDGFYIKVAADMAAAMNHRGPDANGVDVNEHAVFAHSRLAVIDIEGGRQPMRKTVCGYDFEITYNGEIYNTNDLRRELIAAGYTFSTSSDTEVILTAYIHYGDEVAEHLNGIFAFAVWDSMRQRVFLCRDRFGVKPLFYAVHNDNVIFASELKAFFVYPDFKPEVDADGLCEVLAMSPAKTQGTGVFKGIDELRPSNQMTVSRRGVRIHRYWQLESKAHTDSYEATIENVKFLVTDSIKRQLVSDVPIATLLSGGLDSSVISAVGAEYMKEQGKQLSTYSFDYVDNEKYFTPSSFQPDSDGEWALRMSKACNTNHTVLKCDNEILAEYLIKAVHAKDLPGMADVDASLMYYCELIKKEHTVILSGECSDEIFGGYPWFRSEKAFNTHGFPWSYDMGLRESVLYDDVKYELDLQGYTTRRYEESIAETPRFDDDSAEEARRREIAYLNINWFMVNLLDRKDRMSMASGLEVRVPFCDHRIAQYVWNIPWAMKNKDNVSKNVLREAAIGILPEDVRLRRKSPYPKTHNPNYETLIKSILLEIISNPNSPILSICDRKKLEKVCSGNGDYGKPFFGQLMAYPQFIGYIVQLNEWLKHYHVKIV